MESFDLPLPALMARTDFLDYANLAPKLLALNNWILDNSGSPGYQKNRDQQVYHIILDIHSTISRTPY